MAKKTEPEPDVRDQLIAGLRREIELQSKIIDQQNETISTLEEHLEKYDQLMKQMLRS